MDVKVGTATGANYIGMIAAASMPGRADAG